MQMVMIHDILAEYMSKSIPPASILRPPTLCLNNCSTAPWHGCNKCLHQLHPLTIPYLLQHLTIAISRFHTLRCMSEQLLKSLVKAYLEVCPQVFEGIEIWRLWRPLHYRNAIFC